MPKFKKNRVETYGPKGKHDFTIADNVRNFFKCPQFLGSFLDDLGGVRAKRVPRPCKSISKRLTAYRMYDIMISENERSAKTCAKKKSDSQ